MNRRILFRAKSEVNGKWLKGNIYQTAEGNTYIRRSEDSIAISELVDPDTLCQYTGFYAQNHKPIYENDIVECTYFDHNGNDTQVKGIVAWEDWGYCLKTIGDDKKKYEAMGYVSLNLPIDTENEIRVLGNKFDNSYDE